MMKQKIRNITAGVLVFAMVFTIVPAVTLPETKAEEGTETTFSVKAPYDGQLVAAGYIDISWTAPPKDVENYEVYVDGERVAAVTGTTYEYYTTSVAAHQTCVLANYTDGSKETTNVSTFGVSKKGLGLDANMGRNANLKNMGVAWYYNWGDAGPSEGSQYQNVEYVPMVWKETDASNFANRVNSAKSKGYKYILTFNEPDLQGQCDMPLNDVINAWRGISGMEGIHISSPVTALWPQASTEWFQPFMTRISDEGLYDPDFISIHCYPDNYGGAGMASWFLENVVDWTWDKYHKPIWITEFSTTGNNVTATGGNGTKEFWQAVMPELDKREYVERYAGFNFGNANTGLWLYGNGSLTPAGEVYRDLGNPADFVAGEHPGPDISISTPGNASLLEDSKTVNNVKCEDYAASDGVSASASSDTGGNTANFAIDNDVTTRWESVHAEPQTFTVDLGTERNIKAVDILWEGATAATYVVEILSADGSSVEAATVHSGVGMKTRLDSVVFKKMYRGRSVRINCISRATDYGFSIYDIAVYGTEDTQVDVTTAAPTTARPTQAPTTARPTQAPTTARPETSEPATTAGPDIGQTESPADIPSETADSAGGNVNSGGAGNGGAPDEDEYSDDDWLSDDFDSPEEEMSYVHSEKVRIKAAVRRKSSKKIKITLKKKLSVANGYQAVFYKTKSSAKKNKHRVAKLYYKKNRKSFTLKSRRLRKYRKLYVRIRGYEIMKDSRVYGRWSAVKRVK